MREIKFRAWDKESKRMYDWKITRQYPMDYTFNSDIVTPMQYTGLKDKNGTEIYEGDIIKGQDLRKDVISEYISEVFFEDGCWLVHESKTCDVELYLYDNTNPTKMPLTEIEVIGNIYENQELLK